MRFGTDPSPACLSPSPAGTGHHVPPSGSFLACRRTVSPGQKLTSRVTPESGRKTAVREETLDGEQPALDLAIDFVRLVSGAQRVGPLA